MSRYQGSYDAGESRRSPRDQSPGRYNDSRDEFRGGSVRGGERRRSIPDARMNHNAFASNRDNFREPMGRDTSREFPPRDPPRGPKGFPDAPTGPRASSHSTDFRGDFGFRGDFRGERGRGRGRGWRDDSRDRGRDVDREFRDRRDDRGPPQHFREEQGNRDRWAGREPYRGRRASSPQGRGRSPNYGPRDVRDALPSLEIDRTRRGSRDGPLSGGSPAPDLIPSFGRGYGRAPRGGRGRGRGRGGYFEDSFQRPIGRSRSPEQLYRRTQPAATPPPQVPAFGSSAGLPLPAATSLVPTPSTVSGPVPGVAVPTAPRSERRLHNGPPSIQYRPNSAGKNDFLGPVSSMLTDDAKTAPKLSAQPNSTGPPRDGTPRDIANHGPLDAGKARMLDAAATRTLAEPPSVSEPVNAISKRRPILGKRAIKAAKPPALHTIPDEASESDSADELEDSYFEDEISKVESEIARLAADNPLNPRAEPPLAVFIRPFEDSAIDQIVASTKSAPVESCIPPRVKVEDSVSGPAISASLLAPPRKSQSRSRPTTPVVGYTEVVSSTVNGNAHPNVQRPPVDDTRVPSIAREDPQFNHAVPPLRSIEPASDMVEELEHNSHANPPSNGVMRRPTPKMNTFDDSEGDETEAENAKALEAVRRQMKTPPVSSLPNFGNKKWFEDEKFTETLKPDPAVMARVKEKLLADGDCTMKSQESARQKWREAYYGYRKWTDFSNEEITVRSRGKFAKGRAKAAAEAAAPHAGSMPSAGAKPEGQRRVGRFATEHDFERVLRESEQEAKETKDKEDRAARAKTASAKEATIPDMAWSDQEWDNTQFNDRTHLVAFERSFAVLEFGEPIDNFTEEEFEIFEKLYLEFPKQWGKIADALPRRDYKACIQHYYLVKHSSNIKEKLRRQPKKRKARQTKGKNPKSNALMADLAPNREDTEDGQDADGGERRGRPRRAAAPTFSFETPASESEVASPAPTPVRKPAAAAKGDPGSEPAPKKKIKVAREKGSKQAKNSQLLAAAPPLTSVIRPADLPVSQPASSDWNTRRELPPGRGFPPQYDGAAAKQPTFAPPYVPVERPNPIMPMNFEPIPQQFTPQPERLDSAPPMSFEAQQDRRNIQHIQQTSSYWSVPEQTDFPALLGHFGTNWHEIAKWMTSKTHIMVYTTVFQQWLAVPSDSNKSRRVANIQTQVKNYYQRQVDAGKKEWEIIAQDADEKIKRHEPMPPLPTPTVIPKRRYDITPGLVRSSSAMDQSEGLPPSGSSALLPQGSPSQPSLSARFPALAQAGPVPQLQPGTPNASSPLKHTPPQPTQQTQPHMQQQVQQQSRPSRGPTMGYFSADAQRPLAQASDAVSQRSVMVAQEAQIERQSALKLEREQREQQQQREREQQQQREQQHHANRLDQQVMHQREQHAMQQREQQGMQQREQQGMQQREQQGLHRDRHFGMKQEIDPSNPQQYEPYPAPSMLGGNVPHTRPESASTSGTAPPDPRRNAPPQHYTPRSNPSMRPYADTVGLPRDLKSTPSPAMPRPAMSAPPTGHGSHPSQEMYAQPPVSSQHVTPTPQQSALIPPVRQPEPARKSNIMSLLNDEPSEARPTPTKRISDVSSSVLQATRTPPPQHGTHPSARFSSHQPQSASQGHPHMAQQMNSQNQPQPPSAPQSYGQQPQHHPLHQHSSSLGQHPRSYTPTGFDSRAAYGHSPMPPQQQMYSQPPHPSMTSQPVLRREPSLSEIHGASGLGGYSRPSAAPQRVNEALYSATPPPQAPQSMRQPAGSPLELASADRDYYQRQPPQQSYMMQQQQQQQQQNMAASPQMGPSYQHHQQQGQAPNHRQLAFGQSSAHTASPPPQYGAHHSLHGARHNSFDGRQGYQVPPSSAPPSQQGYAQAPQQQSAQNPAPHQRRGPLTHEEKNDRFERQELQRRRDTDNLLFPSTRK